MNLLAVAGSYFSITLFPSIKSPDLKSSLAARLAIYGHCLFGYAIDHKMASIIGLRSVASTVPFFDFCSLLEKISATKGNDKKKKLLSVFIEQWREAHDSLHGNGHVVSRYESAMTLS